VLAIVVARGGSKRLPNKHTRMLLGKRVIDYTFEYALSAKLITRVVLSTDDVQIAKAAENYHVKTIMRPTKLASDTSRVYESLIYTTDYLKTQEGYEPDYVLCLLGNCPIRPSGFPDPIIQEMIQKQCSCVQPLMPVGKHHPDLMVKVNANLEIVPYTQKDIYRIIDTEPLYINEGGDWIYSMEGLTNCRIQETDWPKDSKGIILDKDDFTVEIDDMEDFRYAKSILQSRSDTKC